MNPCGGARWRYLDDGSIEVEGRGVPRYEPDDAHFVLLEQTWDNWSGFFLDAADEYELPVSWLVAIASVETGPWSDDPDEQAGIPSPAGARGVMQIMPATARLLDFDADEMYDPATNIRAGAKLLSIDNGRITGGLPVISGAYNSGKFCCNNPRCTPGCQNSYFVCTDGNYPGAAIKYNNSALAYLDLSPRLGIASVLTWGLMAVGAYGFWVASRR